MDTDMTCFSGEPSGDMRNINRKIVIGLCLSGLAAPLYVQSSELVYRPVNPSFGGNPANSTHLFNIANSQNDHGNPGFTSNNRKSELDQFNERVQRLVLSQIASAVARPIVGSSGELVPGQVETQDFVITVENIGNDHLKLTTLDKLTGEETVFELNQSP